MPDGVVLDGGAAIGVEVATASNNVMQATLTADADGPQHVVARLGDDGPIIASAPVSAFTLFIDESRYQWADDRRHVESAIVADYLPSTVVIEKEMVSEDAYIDVNRTLSKDATANVSAMDPSGLSVAMILPDADDKTIDMEVTIAQVETMSATSADQTAADGIITVHSTPAATANGSCSASCWPPDPIIAGPQEVTAGTHTYYVKNAESNPNHTFSWFKGLTESDSELQEGKNTASVELDIQNSCKLWCWEECTVSGMAGMSAEEGYPITVNTDTIFLRSQVSTDYLNSTLRGGGHDIEITAYSNQQLTDKVKATWRKSSDGGNNWTSLGTEATETKVQDDSTKGTFIFEATRTEGTPPAKATITVYVAELASLVVRDHHGNSTSATSVGTPVPKDIFIDIDGVNEPVYIDCTLDPSEASSKVKQFLWFNTHYLDSAGGGNGDVLMFNPVVYSPSAPDNGYMYNMSPTSREPDRRTLRIESEGRTINITFYSLEITGVRYGGDPAVLGQICKDGTTTPLRGASDWHWDNSGKIPIPVQYVRTATTGDAGRPVIEAQFSYWPETPAPAGTYTWNVKIDNADAWCGTFDPCPTLSGLTLSATRPSAPIGDTVRYLPDATLAWVYKDSNRPWHISGSSKSPVYVSNSKAVLPIHSWQSIVHFSTSFLAGKDCSTESAVVDAIWSRFSTAANNEYLMTAPHRRDPADPKQEIPRVRLTYYKDWKVGVNGPPANDDKVKSLITDADGNCIYWARFLLSLLSASGVSGCQLQGYYPLGCTCSSPVMCSKQFLVNDWTMVKKNQVPFNAYRKELAPYIRFAVCPAGQLDMSVNNSYRFLYSELTDRSGMQGQNNLNPPSIFMQHYFVKCVIGPSTVYYDPSYNVAYSSYPVGVTTSATVPDETHFPPAAYYRACELVWHKNKITLKCNIAAP